MADLSLQVHAYIHTFMSTCAHAYMNIYVDIKYVDMNSILGNKAWPEVKDYMS